MLYHYIQIELIYCVLLLRGSQTLTARYTDARFMKVSHLKLNRSNYDYLMPICASPYLARLRGSRFVLAPGT